MDVYPGNSNAAKRKRVEGPVARPIEKPEPESKERKVSKVVTGRVVQKKKTLGSRFRETFFAGGKEVGEYILHEVIIPSIKDVAIDAVTQFLERGLWSNDPDRAPRRRGYYGSSRPSGRNGWVQYGGSSSSSGNRYSNDRRDEPPRHTSRRERSGFELKETVFESHHDADSVLQELLYQAREYGHASVVDFYDAIDVTADFTDERWGWRLRSLEDYARVRRLGRGEFIVDLPAPERLDP